MRMRSIPLRVISDDRAIPLITGEDEQIPVRAEQVVIVDDLPEYDGDYSVVSALYDTVTLNTKGLKMRSDLQVEPIPIYEVDNPQGGTTVTIGN